MLPLPSTLRQCYTAAYPRVRGQGSGVRSQGCGAGTTGAAVAGHMLTLVIKIHNVRTSCEWVNNSMMEFVT